MGLLLGKMIFVMNIIKIQELKSLKKKKKKKRTCLWCLMHLLGLHIYLKITKVTSIMIMHAFIQHPELLHWLRPLGKGRKSKNTDSGKIKNTLLFLMTLLALLSSTSPG